jgi:serine/threonine protein phosphatase PrpC
MLHYEAFNKQVLKDHQLVCGDHIVSFNHKDSYYFAIFDGVGSGVYANLAAIANASRWKKMIREGISISEACEKMAADTNRARSQKIPFTAFVAVMVTRLGSALIYVYESPNPILSRKRVTRTLKPRFYSTGNEEIGEVKIDLEEEDMLFIFSDGVSQSGMGKGRALGWGEDGVTSFIGRHCSNMEPEELLDALVEHCQKISGNQYEDDTSIIMIQASKARHLSLFSGPPRWRHDDSAYADAFRNAAGTKVICGSTTSGILARELGTRVRLLTEGEGLHSPPTYTMKGADFVTEGAIALNQAANLLYADPEEVKGKSAPEQLARLFFNSDVIDVYEGLAANEAHEMLLFKQLGIRIRREAVRAILNRLEDLGKMVHYYPF